MTSPIRHDTVYWFVGKDRTKRGPLGAADMAEAIKRREITPDTLVWCNSMTDWAEASETMLMTFFDRPPLPESVVGRAKEETVPPELPPIISAPPKVSNRESKDSFESPRKKPSFYENHCTSNGRIDRLSWFARMAVISVVMLLASSAGGAGIVFGLLALPLALFYTAKRYHDVGSNGGWAFLILIQIVGFVAGFFLLIESGENGPNEYGPQP